MLENDPTHILLFTWPMFVMFHLPIHFWGAQLLESCQEEEEDGPSDDRLEAGSRTSAIS